MRLKKISMMLVLATTLTSVSPSIAFAKSESPKEDSKITSNITNSKGDFANTYSSDYYYDELAKIGFTEDEMYDLYVKESEKLSTPLKLPKKLSESIKKDYAQPTLVPKNLNIMSYSGSSKSPFPPNPEIGKVYPITFTVTVSDLAFALGIPGSGAVLVQALSLKTQTEIAQALIRILGLGSVGIVMAAAGVILSTAAQAGYNYGIQWTQDWYYGEDNHMSIGWTAGYAYGYKWI